MALRPIYAAATAEAASAALEAFARGPWGAKFPTVVASWRRAWTHVIPFFAFPPDVRRIIYTTNALESVHAQLRKIIKTRGHFPTDEAATKLIWLARRNITRKWARGRSIGKRDASVCDPLRRSLRRPPDVACERWTLPSLWTHRTRLTATWKPQRTRFPTAPTRIID